MCSNVSWPVGVTKCHRLFVVHVNVTSDQSSGRSSGGNGSWTTVRAAAAGEIKELLTKLKRDEYPSPSELRVTLEHVLHILSPTTIEQASSQPPIASRELADDVSNVSSS